MNHRIVATFEIEADTEMDALDKLDSWLEGNQDERFRLDITCALIEPEKME